MRIGLIFLGFFAFSMAMAQDSRHVCGVSAADQLTYNERLVQNLATVTANESVSDRSGAQYVPIYFHLVANSSGTGRVRESRVLEQLCALNAAYEPVGIQFYMVSHPTFGLFDKTINNDNVYYNQDNTFLMQAKKHPNAINYYITDVAASGNNSPGLVLAYYTPTNDWIVSRRDQINGNANNSTIPHETGHFFSLQHPFLGWESSATGFVPSSAGWPIAPVIAPDGVPTERQNGTNCTTAADKICDTGPDYKFAFSQSDCSPYDRGAKDPLGVLVDPNENNTMSYFDACSLYVFTPLQSAAMLADLNSPARNFLDNTYVPPGTITTPSDLLVSPANGSTVPFYNAVNLEWKAVTNATNYLVEIDIVPSFATGLIKTYVANTNSLLVTDLDPNDTYYWRVKPFNYSDGCANLYSRNFKVNSTPTNTIEVEGLDAWQVSPNPSNGDFARILAKSTETFEANVYMLDATGRIVMDMPSVQFVEGQNSIELTLSGLANGFYFVVIDNGTAKDLRKLIIAR